MTSKSTYFLSLLLITLALLLSACGGATTSPDEATTPSEDTPSAAETSPTEAPTEPAPTTNSDSTTEEAPAAVPTLDLNSLPTPEPFPTGQTVVEASDLETTASGLQYALGESCTADTPQDGEVVEIHYIARLGDGSVFDDSYERGEPIQFPLGQGFIIPGWEEGIKLLSEGCSAQLVIPPELGYGEQGFAGVIPPNATLVFDVELLSKRAGAPAEPPSVAESDYESTASGLEYIDLVEGDGDSPEPGSIVTVEYTGWLAEGDKFDSSLDRGQPFTFALGQGNVIPGWDEGVVGMQVGGTRLLRIPSELAYGEQGAGEVIPPNSTLIFEVQLLEIQAGAADSPPEVDEADYTATDSGLEYIDLEPGDGVSPEFGQQVTVHYTGWLAEDGTKFDSSLDRGQPFSFMIGAGQVIPGWDEGVAGMQVGGTRLLRIPAELAYGEQGAGGIIPPGASLIFEVELLDVQ